MSDPPLPPWSYLMLAAGIILLLGGGHALVEGSVRIARRLGMSTLLIGLTIVAFGTSSPELAFNIVAAVNGNGELSFGNVIGSNIANIALVLGLAALFWPLIVHGRVVKRELPLLIVVTLFAVALAWLSLPLGGDNTQGYAFSRFDGVLMLIVFALFNWMWLRMARTDRSDPLVKEAIAEVESEQPTSLAWAITMFVFGLAALIGGGKLAEVGAVGVASSWGMSKALIGLTIVAFATSLPEVATSVIACRKGHTDLAVGNVVGSNLFNILLVLGVTALVADVPVPAPWGWWDLGVMTALTLLLVPITWSHQNRVLKLEGVFLVACYVGYICFTVVREVVTP